MVGAHRLGPDAGRARTSRHQEEGLQGWSLGTKGRVGTSPQRDSEATLWKDWVPWDVKRNWLWHAGYF